MPNMSGIGGLPTITAPPQLPWTPNGRGSGQGQYEGLLTPQSTGMPMNTPQQTVALLGARMHRKEQEVQAYKDLIADVNRFANEVDHYRNAANTAIEHMATIRREAKESIQSEEQRRIRAEAANADLNSRVSTLEQEKQDLGQNVEDMNTSVMLVQGQNRALEQEVADLKRDAINSENETTLLKGEITSLERRVTSLQDEIIRKDADWSEDRTTSAAAKAQVDGDLVAQRNLRLKIEEERDQVKEEVKELQCELQALTTDKNVATDHLNTARGEVSSLKTSLQDTQQKVDNAKDEIKQARSEIQTLKNQVESQKTEITSLQSSKNEVDQLRSEKAELSQKFNDAKRDHVAAENSLKEFKKTNEELECRNKELDQRSYKTGQERDAAAENLKVQVEKHQVDERELRQTISELKEKLEEETEVANWARDCAAKMPRKRGTPQAQNKSAEQGAVKTQERDAKKSSTSKLSERHVTPPLENNSATSLAISKQAPNDESYIFVAPVASMRSSQPSKEPPKQAMKKISMPLANRTPVKPKTPKVTSPLAGTSSDPAQDDAVAPKTASSTTNANSSGDSTGKRKRSVTEQQPDPRLAKQTLTGSRRLSSENVPSGRQQSSRPPYVYGRRSPDGDPYSRRW